MALFGNRVFADIIKEIRIKVILDEDRPSCPPSEGAQPAHPVVLDSWPPEWLFPRVTTGNQCSVISPELQCGST
jgi:hypothetical protein